MRLEHVRTTCGALSLLHVVMYACFLGGCAPARGPGKGAAPGPEPVWECGSPSGTGPALRELAGGGWSSREGVMTSVYAVGSEGNAPPGAPEPETAVAEAVRSAASGALDLLEQRGVPYAEPKRSEIIDSAVTSYTSGREITFPRFRIAEKETTMCVSSTSRDTTWMAAVLAEYPIGLLRGDANNALWERERAVREAAVLARSAAEYFSSGDWLAGLVDRTEALRVIERTGAATGRAGATAPLTSELSAVLSEPSLSDTVVIGLSFEPASGIEVIEVGAAASAVAAFRCSYVWLGETKAAVGVPVRFSLPGAGAIMAGDARTDESGRAQCRILFAHGEPGVYELSVGVDTDVLAEAGLTTDRAGRLRAGASQRVYLVKGAHAVSVCASFEAGDDVDAVQVLSGFSRRMERDGFSLCECGPDADVMVRGRVSVATTERSGLWSASVVVRVSAFDQRNASDLGETTVTVNETSEKGARETEVMALKEAGRLTAVYFESRMLMSR